jgi:hypothetical protein
MNRFVTAALAALVLCVGFATTGTAAARQLQSFNLVNSSGYTITQLLVRLDGMKWSKNWLRYQVRPNESKDGLYFSGAGASCTGKVWVRTLQRAEFNLDVDFCYPMNIVLVNDGLYVEY